jgi:hypothetical protein
MGNCDFLEVTQQRVNVLTVSANGKHRVDVIFTEGAHVALHEREHRRGDVSYVCMMRRSEPSSGTE